jgi:hypothetical protein
MEHGSSTEANRYSAGPEITQILWNPQVYYVIHKGSLAVPILRTSVKSMYPNSISWRSFLIVCSHINLPLPSGLISSGFFKQKPVYTSTVHNTCHTTCPSHSSWFDHESASSSSSSSPVIPYGRQQNVAIWSYLWPSPSPRSSTSLFIMSTDHEFIESVVRSQVEVSATGRSFVQLSPTDCDV